MIFGQTAEGRTAPGVTGINHIHVGRAGSLNILFVVCNYTILGLVDGHLGKAMSPTTKRLIASVCKLAGGNTVEMRLQGDKISRDRASARQRGYPVRVVGTRWGHVCLRVLAAAWRLVAGAGCFVRECIEPVWDGWASVWGLCCRLCVSGGFTLEKKGVLRKSDPELAEFRDTPPRPP